MADEEIPKPGQWPVDPQEDQPINKERIWVDGVFDFAHHGHAGAMLQARRLGKELWVGIHSDEDVLKNKGPTVMTLDERIASADACRWVTKAVPDTPYVTMLPYISHYGCWFVAHGDDITSDASGEDCYRYVKAAGRMLIFKRTPNISTTDLVGRMLLYSKKHFIKSLRELLLDSDKGPDLLQRIQDYAKDETGFNPGPPVWTWKPSTSTESQLTPTSDPGMFESLVDGQLPQPNQRIVYVDGGFDLFSSGHIEFLKLVGAAENHSAYIVAGIHDDFVINHWKGRNYPIMNIFERGLCVLQCKYINAVVFGAPFSPSKAYLESLPMCKTQKLSAVYHGPTSFIPLTYDPYVDAKAMGILKQIPDHKFKHVNAGEIMDRILKAKEAFEERQRRKGQKAVGEEAARQKEIDEENIKKDAGQKSTS